jgi:hypothetical protein
MDSSSGVLARPPVILATAAVFTVLMLLVRCRWTVLVHFDRAAVDAANDLVAGRPALVAALQWISDLGDRPAVWTAALIATGTLLAGRRFRSALLVACANLGGWAWELAFKAAVGTPRSPGFPRPGASSWSVAWVTHGGSAVGGCAPEPAWSRPFR